NMRTLTARNAFRAQLSMFVIVVAAMMILAQAGSGPSLTGKYEGTAKGPDGEIHLTLDLTDDAGKISGQINSPHGVYKIVKAQMGTSNIANGTWKYVKLAILLEAGAGQIVLKAVIVDGKFSGEYDFAGQSSGKWVAVKKK